jgi:hypothetical protein
MTHRSTVLSLGILLFALAIPSWGQSTGRSYYDTFSDQFINPDKWWATGPFCDQGRTLECVREIQNGHLRLLIRNMGGGASDSGFQFGSDELFFNNPETVHSVTTDVNVRRVNLVGCSTSTDGQPTRTVVKVQGTYFNTGSGDPADDVTNDLYFEIDASDPTTMSVGNWLASANGLGYGVPIGTYPVGTPLIVTNIWDKTNHRFISVVKVKDESGSTKRVVNPYSVSDTTPAVNPARGLSILAYSLNCTSTQTFAQTEAFFDNVIVNAAP